MLPRPMIPALCRLRSTVVRPNPMRPSGAGFALESLMMVSAMAAARPGSIKASGVASSTAEACLLIGSSQPVGVDTNAIAYQIAALVLRMRARLTVALVQGEARDAP